QRKLKNGARVLIVENHTLPLIAVDVRFLHGVDTDPKDKPGLAEFVADMVDEGTKTRPAARLAEEIEDLAAHLGAGASLETASVHLNCLSETLPKALDLLADVVQNPAFRTEDVERVRVLKLTSLEQKKANTGALAADQAARILYGPQHPWGQPAGAPRPLVGAEQRGDLGGGRREGGGDRPAAGREVRRMEGPPAAGAEAAAGSAARAPGDLRAGEAGDDAGTGLGRRPDVPGDASGRDADAGREPDAGRTLH